MKNRIAPLVFACTLIIPTQLAAMQSLTCWRAGDTRTAIIGAGAAGVTCAGFCLGRTLFNYFRTDPIAEQQKEQAEHVARMSQEIERLKTGILSPDAAMLTLAAFQHVGYLDQDGKLIEPPAEKGRVKGTVAKPQAFEKLKEIAELSARIKNLEDLMQARLSGHGAGTQEAFFQATAARAGSSGTERAHEALAQISRDYQDVSKALCTLETELKTEVKALEKQLAKVTKQLPQQSDSSDSTAANDSL